MRLAEEKLGEVKLSSRFAGLEELEEQDVHTVHTHETAAPVGDVETARIGANATNATPGRNRRSNPSRKRHERSGSTSGRDEEKRKGKAPAYAPGRDDMITGFGSASARDSRDSRELELEELTNGPSVSRANNSGANDEDDVDFTEAELLCASARSQTDSGARTAIRANDAADDRRVASEGSREKCDSKTPREMSRHVEDVFWTILHTRRGKKKNSRLYSRTFPSR